jgi:hypothetical protein
MAVHREFKCSPGLAAIALVTTMGTLWFEPLP